MSRESSSFQKSSSCKSTADDSWVLPKEETAFDPSRENHPNTVTRRFAINIGFKCNLRCRFCYYLESIKAGRTKDLSTEEVKRRLRVGRSWGKKAVDLTGGEPTVRPDLPELIAYAGKIGYKDVCIITNGWVIGSEEDYLEKLVDAGLNDILMSLHGVKARTHDSLTCRKGSFERFLAAAERASRLDGLNLRFNHVVCEQNFDEVADVADLMASFRPNAVNFILFQPTRDASRSEEAIRFRNYRQVTPFIMQAIDKHKATIPHINVRDIPFCLLKGYESHVKTLCQLQYEKVEWDYCLDVQFKRGRPFYLASVLAGTALCVGNPYFWSADTDNKKHLALQQARIFTARQKGPQCRSCALIHICDGLVKNYVERNGSSELTPYAGKRITNPTHFIPRDEIE
jgi:MoaA/NifB/PqqE/SkfB family radical SAM enzyme